MTLVQAVGLARLQEEKLLDARLMPRGWLPHTTLVPPLHSVPSPVVLLPLPPQPPPPALKPLSLEEIASCRERGLCFSCNEKYHRGHRCAPRVFLLVPDEEDPPLINIEVLDPGPEPPNSTDLLQAQINFNSLAGHLALKMLQLLGSLSGHQVVVLVDGGSTHNFIQEELMTKLGFSSRETTPLRVMVGNGQQLECTRWCEAITIEIQMTKFIIDLYVLPISRANIVLGVQWLKSLEPILIDYNTLCMKFFHNGCLVELKGDHESTLSSLTPP